MPKSILLYTLIIGLSVNSSSKAFSSCEIDLLALSIIIIISAFLALCFALSTPIFSTVSQVCLIPAVSIKLIKIPFLSTLSSSVSRVVPAMSVTIALSFPKIAFKREDLPMLGIPIIATFMPFLTILPSLAVSNNIDICFFILSS